MRVLASDIIEAGNAPAGSRPATTVSIQAVEACELVAAA
jgi:hypothetical protein